MQFNKNDLIDTTLERFYSTFSKSLDTGDYVPEKYNLKITRLIYKELKKKWRELKAEDKKFVKEYKQVILLEELSQKKLTLAFKVFHFRLYKKVQEYKKKKEEAAIERAKRLKKNAKAKSKAKKVFKS